MKYNFKYKMPFYQKFNILLYPIITIPAVLLLFIPRRESMGLSKFIFGKICFAVYTIYFLYLSFNLVRTLRESKHYNPVVIDDESITFPFKENGETKTWKFKDIEYIQFDYYKTSMNIRKHYYIELGKGDQTIQLYRSWMNHFAFSKLKVLLKRQKIYLEPQI